MKSLLSHYNSGRLKQGINALLSLCAAIAFSFVITTDTANVTTDVFQDAVIAGSGTVTYEANTDVTGVLSFDKSQNHWVDLNALQDDLNGKSRSVFMWVKAENNTTSNQALFAVNAANGDNLSFLWIDDSGDNLEVNRGGTINESASFNMGGEVWHYVGWSYDHTTGETVVYVNGIENDRFTTHTSVPDISAQYSLGQEFDGGNNSDFYNGEMAEVSVWDEVLTGVDIQLAMKARINNGHPKYGNLVGYYSVFGNTGDDTSVLTDHSGRGNHGVMQNDFIVDFTNVQPIAGFNAIDWYENLSWKKDGTQVSAANGFTTTVAPGSYEFVATRDFIESSDVWTMTPSSNAATTDNIADETLCTDDPISRTVPANTVNFLDFERSEGNSIAINSLSEDLKNTNYSVFLWVKKESFIASGDFYQLLAFQDSDVETTSRFYITGSERLTVWDGANYFQSPVGLGNDIWYFVGFTFDTSSKEVKLYINDQEALTSTSLDLTITDNWLATLGARYIDNGLTNYLDGQMAEITIWDKVLTEEEITNLKTTTPAHDAANLVAAYGALPNIADNTLRDLTGNGHDGIASHESIIVDDLEESIPNYNAGAYQAFSWKKNGVEFDTDANATITVEEGSYDYTIAYGSELFPKTENFTLDYTELLPTAPTDQAGAVDGSVTFSVDNIPGATYQWFKNTEGINNVTTSNGLGSNVVNQVLEHNGVIYAATQEGLSISRDGGISFVNKTTADGLKDNRIVSIVFDDNGTLYVGYHKTGVDGFTISTDGGETFISKNIPGVSSQRTRVFHKSSSNNVWTAIENGAGGNLVKISNNGDNVTTYSLPSTPILVFQSGNGLFTVDNRNRLNLSQTSKPSTILVTRDTDNGLPTSNPGRSDFLIANGNYYMTFRGDESIDDELGLYISYGGSTNFKRRTMSRGLGDNSCNSVMISNGVLYVGTDGGMSYSDDDGVSFSTISTVDGLIDNRVNHVFESNGVLYIATDGGLSIKRDLTVLVDNPDANATNRIQGATGPELTVSNLTLGEDGSEYYAVITLGDCSRQTNTVELSVLEAPVITSTTPANNATDIAVDANIEITFSEAISEGTGNIIIKNAADDSTVETISASNATIDGAKLTINPVSNLDFAITYYVELEAGVVNGNTTNNDNLAIANVVTFTTVCPDLIPTQPTPQSGAIGGSASFSVDAVAGASYQWFEKADENIELITAGSHGFPNTNNINSVYESNGTLYVGTNGRGLAFLTNGATTWEVYESGNGNFPDDVVLSVFEADGTLYAGTNGGLAILRDGETNWQVYQSGDSNFPAGFVYSVYASNGDVYAGVGFNMAILKSGETTWEVYEPGDNNFPNNNAVRSVYESNGTLYAGTNGGLGILKNGTATWEVYESGDSNFPNSHVRSIFESNGTLYAGTDDGVAILRNGETDWQVYKNGDNNFPASRVYAIYETNGNIYAGTFSGLAVLFSSETEWQVFQEGVDNFPRESVESIYVSDDTVYAGTFGGGVAIVSLNPPLQNITDNAAANRITGVTTHQLTISNLTEETDQTEYFVVVTKGDCEETSDSAILSITEGTVDVTPPADPAITGISDDTGISNSDGITSDRNLLIHGTAEVNATVEVFSGPNKVGTVHADANGDWTLDITAFTLTESTFDVTVEAIDAAGNRSVTSDIFELTIDFSPPVKPVVTGISDDTGSSNSDGITSDRNLLVHGTAEADATVDIFSGTFKVGTVQADVNGDWTLDITAFSLTQNTSNVTAEAIDAAGNRGLTSDIFVLTIDYTAPAKPVITGISDDTGSSATDGITSDRRLLIHGTAEVGATVEVFSPGGLIGTVSADASGDWTLDITAFNLPEMVSNTTAEAIDVAGNRSATSDTFVITIDFTAPVKPVITGISDDTGSSNSDGITSDRNLLIHGTAEADATVEVFSPGGLIGTVAADANGDWTLDITAFNLPQMVSSTTAEAIDIAGNRSATSDAFVITIDFTAPAKPVITGISDDTGSSATDGTTSDRRLLIHGTAEADATVEVFSPGGLIGSVVADANGDWTLDITAFNLPEMVSGTTAEAIDTAGNRSNTSDAFVITIDFTSPDVAISIDNNSVAGYLINATFSENVSGFSLADISVTGGTASALSQLSASSYTFLVNSSGMVADVMINANSTEDLAGNGNTASNQLSLGFTPVSALEEFTSLQQTSGENMKVSVYPNPASSWLTLDLSPIEADRVDVAFVNTSGVAVYNQNDFGGSELKLNVSSYKSGMYLILISAEGLLIKKKVLIRK